jgi:multidrug resistance efflux pump
MPGAPDEQRATCAELARDSWAPRQRFDTAAGDAQKAVASDVAAKAALGSAEQQIEVLSARRKEVEAKLKQAMALLARARVDLDKRVVKASIDGAILKVNVRPGEYAQAGVLSDPLMTMGLVDPLNVSGGHRQNRDLADPPRQLCSGHVARQSRNLGTAQVCPL